ncbi:MAG: tRNA pseudouridine(54/55) synthase Pus10, partial [Candidatus Hermodarchaeota archaeon]
MGSPEDADILTLARRILEYHPVCNHCLGRQFAWLSTETSNEQRGLSLKLALSMMADKDIRAGRRDSGLQLVTLLADNGMFGPARALAERNSIDLPPEKICSLCSVDNDSLFDRLAEMAKRAKAETDGIEFGTFLVGSIPNPVLLEREDEIRSGLKIMHGETLKADINRELGKHLQRIIDKPVEFDHPDIVIIYDMKGDRVKVRINPIFIAGRYRKLARGIPQSRWDCKSCRGKGCDECGGTGRKYPDSISEYIGIPAQDLAKGTKFKFHAAGREDIDVRMLGSGRPFVIEVSEPRVRTPDLKKIEKRIKKESSKKLEVLDLEISTR